MMNKTPSEQIAEINEAWTARLQYFSAEGRKFAEVQKAYRANQCDDATYLAARKIDVQMQAQFDAEIAEVSAKLEALEAMAADDASFDHQLSLL